MFNGNINIVHSEFGSFEFRFPSAFNQVNKYSQIYSYQGRENKNPDGVMLKFDKMFMLETNDDRL